VPIIEISIGTTGAAMKLRRRVSGLGSDERRDRVFGTDEIRATRAGIGLLFEEMWHLHTGRQERPCLGGVWFELAI
jgi:hypothetical protein